MHILTLSLLLTALCTPHIVLSQCSCSSSNVGPTSPLFNPPSSSFFSQNFNPSASNSIISGPTINSGPGPVSPSCGCSSRQPSPFIPVPTTTQDDSIQSNFGLSGVPTLSGIVVDASGFQRVGPSTTIQTPSPTLVSGLPQLPASFPIEKPPSCDSHIMTIPRRFSSDFSTSNNFISNTNSDASNSFPISTTTTHDQPTNSIFLNFPDTPNTVSSPSTASPSNILITKLANQNTGSNLVFTNGANQPSNMISNYTPDSYASVDCGTTSGSSISNSKSPSNSLFKQYNQPTNTVSNAIPDSPSTTLMTLPGTSAPSFTFISNSPPSFTFSNAPPNCNPSPVSFTPNSPSVVLQTAPSSNSMFPSSPYSSQNSPALYPQSAPGFASYPATVILPAASAPSYSSSFFYPASASVASPLSPASHSCSSTSVNYPAPSTVPTSAIPTTTSYSSLPVTYPASSPVATPSNSFTTVLSPPPPPSNTITTSVGDSPSNTLSSASFLHSSTSSSSNQNVPSDLISKDSPLTYTLLTSNIRDGTWPSNSDADCSVSTPPPFQF